jgi:high-affinity nickel-transport protein
MYLTLILATALGLGMRHATDADHVLAISTIVARKGSARAASGIGVLWGAGHMATILLVGGAIVAFDIVLPARLNDVFEACVALMLILLGARSVLASRRPGDGLPVASPFAVGVVHGLAGSAAAALLIVPLIQNAMWATLYLIVFGLGTIAGMTMLTCAIAGSTVYATRRVRGLDRWIGLGAGAMSVSFGALLLYRIS